MIHYNSGDQKIQFLNLSAYFTMLAIGVGGILEIPSISSRWLAFALLVFQAFAFSRISPTPYLWKKNLYLGLQSLTTILLLILSSGSNFFFILFFIFSVEAMISFPFRWGFAWITIFSAICLGLNIYYFSWQTGITNALPFIAGYFFVGAFSNLFYQAQKAREESQALLHDLRKAHAKLKEYALKAEELAVNQERLNIAREMHDTVGHHLTISSVQLEGALRLLETNPSQAQTMFNNVREQIKEALQALRSAVTKLREPSMTDLPIASALQKITQDFSQATNIPVQLEIAPHIPPLPKASHLSLLRAVQEGLTNVQRHANAHHIWITLAWENEQLILEVKDDGGGIKPQPTHPQGFGLVGLKERMALLGGLAVLENVVENDQPLGCCLRVTIPLPLHGGQGV